MTHTDQQSILVIRVVNLYGLLFTKKIQATSSTTNNHSNKTMTLFKQNNAQTTIKRILTSKENTSINEWSVNGSSEEHERRRSKEEEIATKEQEQRKKNHKKEATMNAKEGRRIMRKRKKK